MKVVTVETKKTLHAKKMTNTCKRQNGKWE